MGTQSVAHRTRYEKLDDDFSKSCTLLNKLLTENFSEEAQAFLIMAEFD